MESKKKLSFVEYLLCMTILIRTCMGTIAFKTKININVYCSRLHSWNSWTWEYIFFLYLLNNNTGYVYKLNLVGYVRFKI